MRKITTKSYLFAVFSALFALNSDAASSIFSDYGQIQNVQTYSTNPFWNPNSPYNSSLPRPIYVQGTDLKTNDCLSIVKSLVVAQCMTRDNCKNTTLSDIRPDIMIQLSKLPNHNYVTACSGYIDSAYEEYVKNYSNALSSGNVSFPAATTPNPNVNKNNTQTQNSNGQKIPQWQAEYKERADEIEEYEREMRGGDPHLTPTAFPMTYADFSFSERMKNDAAGLMPYKDMKAYKTLNVKTAEEWCNDGEHGNSADCMKFFCSPGGSKENESDCITWRCSDKQYYEANKLECDMNKYCHTNPSSDRCMQYKCNEGGQGNSEECKAWLCVHQPGYSDEHIGYCACKIDVSSYQCMEYKCKEGSEDYSGYDRNSTNCKKWLCENDDTYKADNERVCSCVDGEDSDKCMKFRCKEGSDDRNSIDCKKWLCNNDVDYYNDHVNDCGGETNCTAKKKQEDPHVTKAEYENNKCVVKECESGWKPKAPDYDNCEEKQPEIGDDCLHKIIADEPRATEAKYDGNLECKIKACIDGWHPDVSEKKCEEYGIIITVSTDDSSKDSGTACFSRCNKPREDDGFNKILHEKNLLPEGKKVCLIQGLATVVYEGNTDTKFVISKAKQNDIILALNAIKDNQAYGCIRPNRQFQKYDFTVRYEETGQPIVKISVVEKTVLGQRWNGS